MSYQLVPRVLELEGYQELYYIQSRTTRLLPAHMATQRLGGAPMPFTDDQTPGLGPQGSLHARPSLVLMTEHSPRDARQTRYRFLEISL